MRRAILGLILLASCASQPRPATQPVWPSVATRSSHYAGTVVSGPTATDVSPGAEPPVMARVRWVLLSRMPAAVSVPMDSRARLLLAPSGSPLLGSPSLTEGVRLVLGTDAAALSNQLSSPGELQGILVAERLSALPAGATAVLAATVEGDATQPTQDLQLRLCSDPSSPPSDGVQVAYTVSNRSAAATADLPFQQHSETAVFDQPTPGGSATLVLLTRLPTPYPSGPVLATAIQLRPSSRAPADLAAIAGCDADLKQSAAGLQGQPDLLPVGISQSAGIQSALASLVSPEQRRASMTYLADQANAPLCLDVALIADNANLAQLARTIHGATAASNAADLPSTAALGWMLDRSAFQLLTNLADTPESDKLTPELSTVLTQYAGEAARHPPALDEIAHGFSGEDDLRNRIIAQNFLFLSDASPAARIRAFDWLKSRHLAPAAFDPLGSPRDRRRAINRATSQP